MASSRISLAQEDPSVGRALCRRANRRIRCPSPAAVSKARYRSGSVPAGLEPIHVHRQSRDLSEILRLMLLSSNNFIANQVYLEIGAHRRGGPVSLEPSRATWQARSLRDMTWPTTSVSRRVPASAEATALRRAASPRCSTAFAPHAELLQAAPTAGRATRRAPSPASARWRAYARTSTHGDVRFVISLRGGGNLRFRLLQAIERGL